MGHVVGCSSGKRHHEQNHISRGRLSFKLPARSLSWRLPPRGEAWLSWERPGVLMPQWRVKCSGWLTHLGADDRSTPGPLGPPPLGAAPPHPSFSSRLQGQLGTAGGQALGRLPRPGHPGLRAARSTLRGGETPLHALLSLWGFLKRRKVPQAVWADGGSGLVCHNCGRRRGHAFTG